MKLIAKVPCRFGGSQFFIGDEIPEELVASPEAQEAMGVLTVLKGDAAEASGSAVQEVNRKGQVNLRIITKEGTQGISVAPGSVADGIYILQMKQEDAIAEIGAVADTDALLVVDACTRDTKVRAAVRDRVKELGGERNEGDA